MPFDNNKSHVFNILPNFKMDKYEYKVLEHLEHHKIQILMAESRSQTAEFWFSLLGNMSDVWTEFHIRVIILKCAYSNMQNLDLVLQICLTYVKGTMANPCVSSEQTGGLSLSSENRSLWFIKF